MCAIVYCQQHNSYLKMQLWCIVHCITLNLMCVTTTCQQQMINNTTRISKCNMRCPAYLLPENMSALAYSLQHWLLFTSAWLWWELRFLPTAQSLLPRNVMCATVYCRLLSGCSFKGLKSMLMASLGGETATLWNGNSPVLQQQDTKNNLNKIIINDHKLNKYQNLFN